MNLRLLACNVFQREACHALARTPHVVDVTFLPLGEHNRPDILRGLIQAQIDATAGGEAAYDAVLVLFGLCGNAAVGLTARNTPLVIPRAHDCATILLGSRAAFRRCFEAKPSHAFGCAGYCERGGTHMQQSAGSAPGADNAEYQSYVRQYGEEDAAYIWETMHPPAADDGESWYIRVPESDAAGLSQRFRSSVEQAGRRYVELPGSLRLIEALLNGSWDPEEFLVVPPGARTVGLYDWEKVIGTTATP